MQAMAVPSGGEFRRMLLTLRENLRQFILQKRGLPSLAARLAHRGWNWALLTQLHLKTRLHSRRMTRVTSYLQNAQQLLFLGSGKTGDNDFAAKYWNDRLIRLRAQHPVAVSASLMPQTEIEKPVSVKKGNYPSCEVTDKQIEMADLILVMETEVMDLVNRHHPRASAKTFLLDPLSPDKKRILDDSEIVAEPQPLEGCRRIASALNLTLDSALHRRRGSAHSLRVFMFHAVVSKPLEIPHYCFLDKSLFVQQIDLIKRHFAILPLSEAVLKMQAGELNEPTAAITFDDGFHNNYTVAFPELERRKIPATIFVSTGFTDSDRTLWFCRILRAVTETAQRGFDWNGRHYKLLKTAEKSYAATALMAELKRLPRDLQEAKIVMIETQLGIKVGATVDSDSPFRIMSSRSIREMAGTGLVEFGGHTHSHAILSLLPACDQQKEICSSVEALNRLLGRPCTLFAYPNGRFSDFDEHSIAYLQQAGVSIALTAVSAANSWYGDALEMGREPLGPSDREWVLENRIRQMIASDRISQYPEDFV